MSKNELRDAQRAIVAALGQHTAHNYRSATTVVRSIHSEIDKLARDLAATLFIALDSLTQAEKQAFIRGKYTTSRLKALKAEIDGWALALNQAIEESWKASALELADYEVSFISDTMHKAVDGLPKAVVSSAVIMAAASREPIAGQFVDDMLKGIAGSQKERVYATIRQGLQSGETNSQIVRSLRGTEAMRYQDGLMQIAKRDAERIVRTARNHISSIAYDEVYDKLGVKYVVRVATLEGRTCVACAGLDGKVYKREEPKPPATLHPNCRCQYAPSFDGELVGNRPFVRALKVRKRDGSNRFRSISDMTEKQRKEAGLNIGQVQAKTTYASWFKNQDAAFQRQWLGEARYKLYKKGEMPIERFSDPLGKPYTLEQLKQRDKETFKAVFGD